jgi:hypothetical protein
MPYIPTYQRQTRPPAAGSTRPRDGGFPVHQKQPVFMESAGSIIKRIELAKTQRVLGIAQVISNLIMTGGKMIMQAGTNEFETAKVKWGQGADALYSNLEQSPHFETYGQAWEEGTKTLQESIEEEMKFPRSKEMFQGWLDGENMKRAQKVAALAQAKSQAKSIALTEIQHKQAVKNLDPVELAQIYAGRTVPILLGGTYVTDADGNRATQHTPGAIEKGIYTPEKAQKLLDDGMYAIAVGKAENDLNTLTPTQAINALEDESNFKWMQLEEKKLLISYFNNKYTHQKRNAENVMGAAELDIARAYMEEDYQAFVNGINKMMQSDPGNEYNLKTGKQSEIWYNIWWTRDDMRKKQAEGYTEDLWTSDPEIRVAMKVLVDDDNIPWEEKRDAVLDMMGPGKDENGRYYRRLGPGHAVTFLGEIERKRQNKISDEEKAQKQLIKTGTDHFERAYDALEKAAKNDALRGFELPGGKEYSKALVDIEDYAKLNNPSEKEIIEYAEAKIHNFSRDALEQIMNRGTLYGVSRAKDDLSLTESFLKHIEDGQSLFEAYSTGVTPSGEPLKTVNPEYEKVRALMVDYIESGKIDKEVPGLKLKRRESIKVEESRILEDTGRMIFKLNNGEWYTHKVGSPKMKEAYVQLEKWNGGLTHEKYTIFYDRTNRKYWAVPIGLDISPENAHHFREIQ